MILILTAGILWGCMGLFVRPFNDKGLNSWDIVFLRAVLTTVFMAVVLLIKDKRLFKIRLKDLWCFFGTGILSIVFFNLCYFKEITITSLSVAAILLYTAPAFVMIISAICFKERLTKPKIIALLLAFIGLIFVTGVFSNTERYDSYTISFYTFLFAAFTTVFFADGIKVASTVTSSSESIVLAVIFVLVSTIIPYLTYTIGLKEVENGQASIIASIEPVAATLIGIVWYKEDLSVSVIIGALLVIAGIVVSNARLNTNLRSQ